MKELFEKIYIKLESDLPKESGYFYASIKEFKPRENQMWNRCYEKGHNDNWWLTEVDWYLQPLQSEEQPKRKKLTTMIMPESEMEGYKKVMQPKAETKGDVITMKDLLDDDLSREERNLTK